MKTKFLLAATVAASLASTLAMAGEADLPLTGAQAEVQAARGDAPLAPNRFERGQSPVVSAAAVPAHYAGTLDSDSHSAFGPELNRTATVSRAQVKAELAQAIANGTLSRTDADFNRSVVQRGQLQAE